MSTTTTNLELFKYDPVADANNTYNITNALNGNWDKIDVAIGKLSTLTTTEKTNLVGAINEVKSAIPTVPDISGKLDKAGGKMTGTLQFDKALDGIAYNTNPNMLMHLNHTIDANSLPANHIYCNGRVMVDNANKQCFREYDRYSTGGTYTHNIQVTNYDAQGEAHSSAISLSVDVNGQAFCNFPKCSENATTSSTASTSNVAVVVQNYVNGTDWYRVWSDGWIEQGGLATVSGSTDLASVTLLKKYKNTNYCVTGIAKDTVLSYVPVVQNLTKTAFEIRISNLGGSVNTPVYWTACGY